MWDSLATILNNLDALYFEPGSWFIFHLILKVWFSLFLYLMFGLAILQPKLYVGRGMHEDMFSLLK